MPSDCMCVKAAVGATISFSALIETVVVTMVITHASIDVLQALRLVRRVATAAYDCMIAFRILLVV